MMDLHVVETRPGSLEYPWDFKAGQDYHQYAFPTLGNMEKGLAGKELTRTVDQTLGSIRPDVVVTVGWADQEYHAILLWAIKNKIPRVVISDSGVDDVRRYRIAEKLKSAMVSCFSTGLVAGTRSRYYLEKLGMKTENIFQPWDVVDNEYFSRETEKIRQLNQRPSGLPEKYFLCVSRLVHKKNIPGLLRAFKKFFNETNSGYKLVILGSGEMEAEIKEVIRNADLQDDVLSKGFVQLEELPEYYAWAEALILPSYTDQWGLVVNEAMASGLPVLVSKHCGCVDEIVGHNVNGYVFDPFDSNDIAGCLIKFNALTEEDKACMGRESQKLISQFRPEDFASGLRSAVERSLEKKSGNLLVGQLVLRSMLLIRS